MRILLIEPDRLLAEIYYRSMTDAGHKVVVCAGAQAAIIAADQSTPDLLVIELQLVEHSGIEFLYEFRSYPEWQPVPAIAHTMVPQSEFAASQQLLKDELGVAAYLYKPQTSLSDLINKIDELAVAKA